MSKHTKFVVSIFVFCIGSMSLAQNRAPIEQPASGSNVAQALEKSLNTNQLKEVSNKADAGGLIRILRMNGAVGNIVSGKTIIGTEKEKNPNGCYPYLYIASPYVPKTRPKWVAGYICPSADSISPN